MEQETPEFKGRALEPDSADLLFMLSPVEERLGKEVLMYDVGRLRGRLKALTAGLWRTPAVVVNGEKHVGLAAAREALSALGTASETGEATIVTATAV